MFSRHLARSTAALALCGVLVLIAARVSADDVSGVISGFIVDERSAPVSHATVSISAADAAHGVRVTDDKGFFAFLGVLPGRYYVVANKNGRGACSGSVSVLAGITTSVKVTLRPPRRSGGCHFTQPEPYLIY
ncbi:MAG: carboxypeptidase regulatory-like domain-containing protein [Candidatus Eremiobacteraeota bacterium]|nr:carboxypeptidase regulatory-like domain-containing protein [Candidatus Eremiobacteraeota bacterium]